MKRLIDDKGATVALLYNLIGGKADITHARFNECIYELYAPIPEWYEKLDHDDDQTWVLCFISDVSSKSRDNVRWVMRYYGGRLAFGCLGGGVFLYATPVDLSIRYEVQ
jgi:hypothetical protein